jgi:SpoVK/Ycf46/Vps4 family AAA+-type ATPase
MNSELVRRIVRAAVSRDDAALVGAVRQLAQSEAKQGHTRTAADLEAIVSNGNARALELRPAEALPMPLPKSRMEGTSLVQVMEPRRSLSDIFLDEDTYAAVSRFLLEYSNQTLFAAHGVTHKRKLLFFGPPGNGKTLCAEVIARELGLPLCYVRLDSIIASYLGETAANLRRVFDYGNTHNAVLFFDEFDAIGKTRDDGLDVGELKRVVNSFLQMLDGYAGEGPLIAATNYEQLLDYGLWRRFDDIVFFPKAASSQLEKYFDYRFQALQLGDITASAASALCDGCSFSDAERIAGEAVKTMVLDGRQQLSLADFEAAANRFRSFQAHRSR